MPNNVTEADIWTATVQSQADGEGVNAANELLSHQDLADRTRYIYNRTLGGGVGVQLVIPLGALLTTAGSMVFSGSAWGEQAAAGDTYTWPLILPVPTKSDGSAIWQIDDVTVYTVNNTGHAGSAPSGNDRQGFSLSRMTVASGGVGFLSTVYDPADAATLDTAHSWSHGGGIGWDVSSAFAAYFSYKAENGANAQIDTDILGVIVDLLLK